MYRDALVVAAGAPDLVTLSERRNEIETLAGSFGTAPFAALPRLTRCLHAVLEADEALAGNVNGVSLLERMLFELGRQSPPQVSQSR